MKTFLISSAIIIALFLIALGICFLLNKVLPYPPGDGNCKDGHNDEPSIPPPSKPPSPQSPRKNR